MCQLMNPTKLMSKIGTDGNVNQAYKSILTALTNISFEEVLSFDSLVSVCQEKTC